MDNQFDMFCSRDSFIRMDLLFHKKLNLNKEESCALWFGLVSLFNDILTFVGYLMPKPFS